MANETNIRLTATDATREAFRSVQSSIGKLQSSVKGIAGPLAAAFSVTAIASFSKQLIDAADSLSDLATVTGISASELSKFGNAAQLNGSSTEQFQQAIVKFSNSIGEAAAGSTAQVDAFNALGISIRDANGNIKPTIDLFKELADRYSQTADGAGKIAVTQDLLGKAGTGLIPVLNQGAAALERYEATFSPEFIKASADFNDNLDKLTINFQKLAATNLTPFLQAVNQLLDPKSVSAADQLKNKIAELQGILNASVGTTYLEKLFGKDFGSGKIKAEIESLQERLREINKADAALSSKTPTKLPAIVRTDSKAAKDAEKTMTDALKERNAALVEQYKALGIIDTPFDRYRNQVMALDEGLKSGLLTQDQYLDKLFAAENAYQDGLPAIAQYREQVKELEAQIGVANISFREFSEGAVMTLEDSLVDLVSGTKSATEAFRNMANSIISDLIRMYIRYTITKPLFDFLFPSLLPKSQAAPIVNRDFASPGPRAIGGSVQAGGSYMVGERGPELFVPARSGSIVPNDQMGGGTVVINQSLNFSTGVAQTVRAEVMNMLPMISNAAKAAVADAKLRGGSFANAMR